ncbi:VapA/VapB family virulence-associated protein [Bacillus cereus]|uniref:VapA/VapB family virulence-associated protein n=1 Tax=Bacillus cereus TaxID=1396 RepID=UPI003D17E2BA
MDEKPNVSQLEMDERVSRDLKQLLNGTLKPDEIDRMITQAKTNTKYHAEFRALGAIFYTHYWIWTPDAESPYAKFNGDAGGINGIGQAGEGDIYTNDIEALINNTTSFAYFAAAGVYFSVYFYDKHSNLLGHFQAGGIGTPGAGGGTGKWTRTPPELKD